MLYLAVRQGGAEADRAVVPVLEASARLARDARIPFHSSAAVACQLLGSDRVIGHRLRRCCDVSNSANLENGILLQVEKQKGALTALVALFLKIYFYIEISFYMSTFEFFVLLLLVYLV